MAILCLISRIMLLANMPCLASLIPLELMGTGVTVTIVAPDFVLNEIHRRAFGKDGKPLGSSPVQEEKIMTAEECSSQIATAMENRDRLAHIVT